MARLVVGNAKLFVKRHEKTAPNTAIHLLLDLGGSMDDEADLAIRSALGLVHGLGQIRGVNPALSVFPGSACGRCEFAVSSVICHGERLAQVDPKEVGYLRSRGSTPIFEAITYAGVALHKCRETRKVIIVITDGCIDEDECKDLVKLHSDAGIQFFGIQIGSCNTLANLMPNSALIRNIADLKGVLFGIAKKILLAE